MNKIVLKAQDLDGFLLEKDKKNLEEMEALYREVMLSFNILSTSRQKGELAKEEANIIALYNKMGQFMQAICGKEERIHVHSFETPHENHAEASRLIAKLRDVRTGDHEFVYYIQRAYEMLFKLAYTGPKSPQKNYLVVKTPVTVPVQNYAVHKIPNIDAAIKDSVMCVMLRGALLPSMIMSKEIEEYSSKGYVTPFALFKIKRDDSRHENDMEYILDLDKSYFRLEDLDGKDLIFADPMNATGGSLVTVVKFIMDQGIKPKSVKFFNTISALKGSLRVVRALENCDVYTLWMDPLLNESAYILPGLGDAGDRINGRDSDDAPRNMLQLIADYGTSITNLYRSQLGEIEETVLGRHK